MEESPVLFRKLGDSLGHPIIFHPFRAPVAKAPEKSLFVNIKDLILKFNGRHLG
jgi:hypothetical protein